MSRKKYNLLLDLDQTLISAEASEEFDFEKYKNKKELFRCDDMDGYYLIFNRPYLQEFLDYVFENFNITIWTAATKDYALFIIEKIILNNKKERKLDYILFSYHCDISKKRNKYSKVLSTLWDIYNLDGYTPENTIILDDYKEDVYKSQPNNCIIAIPFEFKNKNSEKDKFLKDIIPYLEKINKDEYNINDVNTKMNLI